MSAERKTHEFAPVFDEHSTLLILGSFPSVKSREVGFYYGHPRNRFWRLLSTLLDEDLPQSTDEKRELLLRHGIALWDVCKSCEVVGSSDATIREITPNDLTPILETAQIGAIFTNGKTAHSLYQKQIYPKTKLADICLGSTSPANAARSFDSLLDEWKIILHYIKGR